MTGIYKIVNIVTNDVYIGKSIDIKHRFRDHMSELRTNQKVYNEFFQRSFNKYGEHNFKLEILEECDEQSLNDREIYWIAHYRQNYPHRLYNVSNGGDGGRMPDDIIEKTKIKISNANKGNPKLSHPGKSNPMYGKHHTEASKQLMSQHKKGQIPWNKGIPHSEETKKKISEINKGRKLTQAQRQKISLATKGKSKKGVRKWTDELCNEVRNLHLIGISYYQLEKIFNKNAETIRYSVRRYEKEKHLPNSGVSILLLDSHKDREEY